MIINNYAKIFIVIIIIILYCTISGVPEVAHVVIINNNYCCTINSIECPIPVEHMILTGQDLMSLASTVSGRVFLTLSHPLHYTGSCNIACVVDVALIN